MKYRQSRIKNIRQHKIYYAIASISLICVIFSTIIFIENIQINAHKQDFCSALTGTSGCETVQSSIYSKTFGISNSVYGIIGFTILLILSVILAFKEQKILKIITMSGILIAAITATYFLYLQTRVIHAYCIFCLVVDILSFALLVIEIYILVHNSKHKHTQK